MYYTALQRVLCSCRRLYLARGPPPATLRAGVPQTLPSLVVTNASGRARPLLLMGHYYRTLDAPINNRRPPHAARIQSFFLLKLTHQALPICNTLLIYIKCMRT